MEQLVAIAAFGLERMAEGMAEIEQRAARRSRSSAPTIRGLGGAGDGDGVAPGGEIAVEQGGAMALQPGEEAASPMRPYFTTSA